jgi:hypothetical protein
MLKPSWKSFVVDIVIVLSCSYSVSSQSYKDGNYPIVTDLKLVSSKMHMMDVTKDASFDCWMNAVNQIERRAISTRGSTFHEQDSEIKLSPGGNFCAHMKSSGDQLDGLAFELTKCEYERFIEPLPTNCSFNDLVPTSGKSTEILLKECMSSLTNDTFLAVWTTFTQYKISSFSLCSKLTEELALNRQNAAAYKLQETIETMEDRMEHVLSRADSQLEQTVSLMESRMWDLKKVRFDYFSLI